MGFDFTQLIRMSDNQDTLTREDVIDQVKCLKYRFFEKAVHAILARHGLPGKATNEGISILERVFPNGIPDFSTANSTAQIAAHIKEVFVWLDSYDFKMFAFEIADEMVFDA